MAKELQNNYKLPEIQQTSNIEKIPQEPNKLHNIEKEIIINKPPQMMAKGLIPYSDNDEKIKDPKVDKLKKKFGF
jgi:hypothetical protein